MEISTSYMELGAAALTGVLGPILVQYFKHRFERKPDLVLEAANLNITVSEQLEDIKDDLDADRVWLNQFHNGGHFYPTGKSIQKFSMVYECVSESTPSIQDQFQNIPISLFAGSVHHVLTNDYLCIPDFSKPSLVPYGLQHILMGEQSKSLYMFALKDIKGRFMGIIGIEFIGRKGELNENTINSLKVKSAQIAGLLENHLIVK